MYDIQRVDSDDSDPQYVAIGKTTSKQDITGNRGPENEPSLSIRRRSTSRMHVAEHHSSTVLASRIVICQKSVKISHVHNASPIAMHGEDETGS